MPKQENATETVKGHPGRPPSFIDEHGNAIPTVAFMSKIPAETREMVRQIAKQRDGEALNATLDAMIRRAFKVMNKAS